MDIVSSLVRTCTGNKLCEICVFIKQAKEQLCKLRPSKYSSPGNIHSCVFIEIKEGVVLPLYKILRTGIPPVHGRKLMLQHCTRKEINVHQTIIIQCVLYIKYTGI